MAGRSFPGAGLLLCARCWRREIVSPRICVGRIPVLPYIRQDFYPGLNAARRASGQDGIVFDRAESYIGVLIDDLITRGVSERTPRLARPSSRLMAKNAT